MRNSERQGGRPGDKDLDTDVFVVGSGFGGSVAALRLTEKGYRVTVAEAGRRFEDEDFAKTSWRLHKYVWFPKLRLYGIQRIHLLRNVLILAGAGVGGGSLVYANTLYKPPRTFFEDRQWGHITDWADELDPYYDQATRMLGVVENPTHTPADKVIKRMAERMGVGETYHPTPVGVFFDKPGELAEDPYFGGAGPARRGCIECGECMTGCRHNAKNTLVKNYLYLAEKGGAKVEPLTTVTRVRQLKDGTWKVTTERTGAWFRKRRQTRRVGQVVMAAGSWGTQQLLHRMKDEGTLKNLSSQLGHLTRTNSEAIVGSGRLRIDPDLDLTEGTAITSSFHPDEFTHIEPCRYGKGSNAIGLLQTLATEGDTDTSRFRQLLTVVRKNPKALLLLNVRNWSQRTIILLVMQSIDNSLNVSLKRKFGRSYLTSAQGYGEPNPTFIRTGYEANKIAAEEIGGTQGSTWNELFDIPLTAHFLGGCPIGDSVETGVIDPFHRVYNYPGLHVVDGASVSANLGVNPSLTITAQAERAFALWPNKDEQDARPELGAGYERVGAVQPTSPLVPYSAPAALRLPLFVLGHGNSPATGSATPAAAAQATAGEATPVDVDLDKGLDALAPPRRP